MLDLLFTQAIRTGNLRICSSLLPVRDNPLRRSPWSSFQLDGQKSAMELERVTRLCGKLKYRSAQRAHDSFVAD